MKSPYNELSPEEIKASQKENLHRLYMQGLIEKEEQERAKKEIDAYWAGSCAGVLKKKESGGENEAINKGSSQETAEAVCD